VSVAGENRDPVIVTVLGEAGGGVWLVVPYPSCELLQAEIPNPIRIAIVAISILFIRPREVFVNIRRIELYQGVIPAALYCKERTITETAGKQRY
jgi:hypothetical protein